MRGLPAAHWPSNISRLLGPSAVSTVYGSEHAALRKLLNPAFSHRSSHGYLPGIIDIVHSTFEEWAAKGRVHASPSLKRLTFQVSPDTHTRA